MATYRIPGVWLNSNKIITRYVFHLISDNSCSKAVKKAKAQTIALFEVMLLY